MPAEDSGYSRKRRSEYVARSKRRQQIFDRSRRDTNRRASILKAARSAARKSGVNVAIKQGRGPRIPGTR